MHKFSIALLVMALFSAQQVLADDMSSMPSSDMSSKSCEAISDACLKAGFERSETSGKQLWKNCMKPLILAKKVSGVDVDPIVVKSCRADKIIELQKELNELHKVTITSK